MTVSDVLLEILAAHGVKHLFGIPGDAINDVMNALRQQDAIEFVQVRHEEAGAFAASAQAKLTGQLAACMGTAGPGGIHLLNGLYDAKLDHAPVVAITGQVETGFLGTQHHQEVDHHRLFSDVACYSQTVTTKEQVPRVFLEACRAAIVHRGVAHISLPTDVSSSSASLQGYRPSEAWSGSRIAPAIPDCQSAVEILDQSERIAILAGIGCAAAREELVALARKLQAPIIRSLKAKEVIDDDHELCVGGLGMLGGSPAVKTMDRCDALLIAGSDFPYVDFYPESARTIQIDDQPAHIAKRHPVDVGLVGDARATLAELAGRVASERSDDFLAAMQSEMADWREEQQNAESSDDVPIKPERVMRELGRAAPDHSIFTVDTGTATAWSARNLRLRSGQRYVLSGGLASMAFALPAAIGAQLAYPERRVFAITGDGAFAMLMGDFVTAVKYRLPIVVLVLNNAKLAFITLEQEAKGIPDWGTALTNPDFAAVAEACGGVGIKVAEPGEIGRAIQQGIDSNRPAVIDIAIDPDALILPPRIEFSQAMNFGLAKLREFFGAD